MKFGNLENRAKTQTQIHKHKYANTNTQTQIHKHQYTNTSTQTHKVIKMCINIQSYKYTEIQVSKAKIRQVTGSNTAISKDKHTDKHTEQLL